MKNLFLLFPFFAFLLGCDANHNYADGSSSGGYTFNMNVDPELTSNAHSIITGRCLSCHSPGSPYGHLDFNEMINDGYITAGPPQASVLYRCLNNTLCITRKGNVSDNMAQNGELTAEELKALNDFIDALFIDPS